jgi:hypothetical protein
MERGRRCEKGVSQDPGVEMLEMSGQVEIPLKSRDSERIVTGLETGSGAL